MKVIDYDAPDDSGNTATHIATDAAMEKKFGNLERAYEEGFAASSGVRAGTAETDGRIKHPETGDNARTKGRIHSPAEDENAGLADN